MQRPRGMKEFDVVQEQQEESCGYIERESNRR